MVSESSECSPKEKNIPDPFEVVSIRSVKAPPGLTGTDWYRYEICQGHNQIIGFRSGDKDKVNLAVKDIVHGLNFRRQLKRGRTHVVLGSHKKNRRVKTMLAPQKLQIRLLRSSSGTWSDANESLSPLKCSFCCRGLNEIRFLVGRNGVRICDQCLGQFSMAT